MFTLKRPFFVAVLLLATLLVPHLAFAQSTSGDGWIFLGINEFMMPDLFMMDVDGSNVRELAVNGVPLDANYVAASPDGRYLALLRATEVNLYGNATLITLDLLNRATQQVTPLTQFPVNASVFSWSPDSRSIVYAAGDMTYTNIMVINIDGTGQRAVTDTQSQRIQAFDPVWSPDGTQITFTASQSLAVVNADGTDMRIIVPAGATETAKNPVWSPDGTQIAYVRRSADGMGIGVVRLDGSAPVTISPPSAGLGRPIWLPNSNTIAFSGGDMGAFNFYTMNADGSGVVPFPNFVNDSLLGFELLSYVPPLPVGDSGAVEAVTAPGENAPASGQVISTANAATLQLAGSVPHTAHDGVRLVAFHPNNTLLAFADDAAVQLWDTRTNASIAVLRANAPVTSLAFSPDGARLAVGDQFGAVYLFDAGSGGLLASQQVGDSRVALAFNPAGTILATGTTGIAFWDAFSLAFVGSASLNNGKITEYINDLTFSLDGTKLAYAEETGYSGVIDLASGTSLSTYSRLVREVDTGTRLIQYTIALNPTGSLAATCHDSGTSVMEPQFASPEFFSVDVWDVTTGVALVNLTGHRSMCRAIAFSPDGTILATGGQDNKVRLWDVTTGQELAVFTLEDRSVHGLTFSPDGAKLAAWSTGDNSGTVQWWTLAP